MKLTLPWPDSALNPNNNNRWKKIAARKKQRADCCMLAGKVKWHRNNIPLIITFHPPDKRHRDLDNCLGSLKGALDGICDAWDINDKAFRPITIDFGDKVKGGAVVIEFN